MQDTTDAEFLRLHFGKELSDLENLVKKKPDISYHELFKNVDDDLFSVIVRGTFDEPSSVRSRIPGWPSERARAASTSDLPLHLSVLESLLFWRSVKTAWSNISDKLISECRVADYGGGWGRVTRLVAKDVPENQIFTYEPNPIHCQYYRECRVPGTLVQTAWASNEPIKDDPFDLIICFSILTHSSDRLTRNIRDRWIEMTRPGSAIFTTVRPRFFIDGTVGDAGLLPVAEKDNLRTSYDRGELVYRPYRDSTDWGVTVMSAGYIENVFGPEFEIKKMLVNPLVMNQITVCMIRR